MTDTKLRTAEQIVRKIAIELVAMFESKDPYATADIVGLLESWRRELLADRAEAEAAEYQRAVREIARWVDMEPTWVLGKDIRARFGV